MSKQQKNKKSEPKDKKGRTTNSYVKYSGMAIQMGVTVLIGALIGKQIDAYVGTEKPYFTIVMALIAIIAALYLTLKDLIQGK